MVPLAPDTLERLVPDQLDDTGATGAETLRLHLQRYEFAARFLRPGRVLDIACGAGYGTRLLVERGPGAVQALGVDVSPAAVGYAQRRYGAPNARFEVGDALSFEPGHRFGCVVSLETVEHMADPRRFVARLVDLLEADGVLVASVPTTPSVDLNPHHRHDFTESSFRRMLAPHGLREIDCLRQVQPVDALAVLRRRETRMLDVRDGLLAWYLRHPGALARRLAATCRYGFSNRYLTVAWRKPSGSGAS